MTTSPTHLQVLSITKHGSNHTGLRRDFRAVSILTSPPGLPDGGEIKQQGYRGLQDLRLTGAKSRSKAIVAYRIYA